MLDYIIFFFFGNFPMIPMSVSKNGRKIITRRSFLSVGTTYRFFFLGVTTCIEQKLYLYPSLSCHFTGK